MRTIALSSSILAFWADLVFVEAALLADEETVSIAVPITASLAQFTDILTIDLSTRRAQLQAAARGSVADNQLDGGLRSLFSAVLHLIEQDRKRAEFTTIFPENIGRMVRHALKRQLEVAVDIASKLTLKIYPEAFRDERLGLLQPLIAKGEAALSEQRAAEIARVDGRLDVQAWKQDANAVRVSVYGELVTLGASKGRKKAWADAFFPGPKNGKAPVEADEEAGDEEPGEGSGGGNEG